MSGIDLIVLIVLFTLTFIAVGLLVIQTWSPHADELTKANLFSHGCVKLRNRGCTGISEIILPIDTNNDGNNDTLMEVCTNLYCQETSCLDKCLKLCGCS